MKSIVSVIFALLIANCTARPSTNAFYAVTNDWYNANFSNVYELAQYRMSINSNDIVAAYLMFDWDVCFSPLNNVSNSIAKVITLSDMVTNSVFSKEYVPLRASCISFRDELLPSIDESKRQVEQYKSYLPHKSMPSEYMLMLLDKAGLW